MLKMYQENPHLGGEAELWEKNWEAGQFNQVLQFCRVDPLLPLFEKYAKKGMKMLEGGCGLGQYVTFQTFRGVEVVGLDFAQRALHRLNRRVPDSLLSVGDVSKLPFVEKSFDVYYSGGVVEHFEGGVEQSLNEAHRVLKKDGVLLISVPYFSPLRRLLYPLKRKFWRKVRVSEEEDIANGLSFFQYAYQTEEFERLLADSNLKVVKKQGYAIVWGLYELPIFKEKSGLVPARENSSSADEEIIIPDFNESVRSSILKRLLVSEDATVPFLGLGVKFLRWFASNMMMYVCIKQDSNFRG